MSDEERAIAAAFRDLRDETLREAHLPAAGQVWWRCALRAQAEAAAAARRPMIWLQGVAGACAAGLGAAFVATLWPSIPDVVRWVAASTDNVGRDLTSIVEPLIPTMPLVLAAVGCLVVTPLVVYFAISDD